MATIQEVHEATGVSIRQITKFIKEGRISVANNPNMMYPCEVCGVLIRQGNMCDSCRTRLTRDLTAATRDDAPKTAGLNEKPDKEPTTPSTNSVIRNRQKDRRFGIIFFINQ